MTYKRVSSQTTVATKRPLELAIDRQRLTRTMDSKVVDMAIVTRLRFKQLALVANLHETRNLHTTAEQMNLSQPGATKLLKEIEAALGVSLFFRQSRGMDPTLYGDVVARYARRIIADTLRMKTEVEAMSRGQTGTVRLGAIMAAVPELVTHVLAAIPAAGHTITVELTVSTSDNLLRGLSEGTLDLVLGRPIETEDTSEITFEPLTEENLSIVGAANHVLCQSGSLKLADLANFSWVLQPRPSPMRTSIELAFARKNLSPPDHRVETVSMLTTTLLVGESDLLAVLPESVARYYQSHGMISVVPVTLESLLGQYGLIFTQRNMLDPATRTLADLIRQSVR